MIKGKHTLSNFFQLKESQEKLESYLAELDEENKNIAYEIEKIENSSDYAKKILKDKYHLLEEGEEVFFYEQNLDPSSTIKSKL